MRGAAGRVRHLAVDHLVSSDQALSQLAERDFLHADQELIVRVGLVPATELVRLLAYASVALAPPCLLFSIKPTVADRPGHGDLASCSFAASLTPQRAGEDVAVFFGYRHHFSPGKKYPLNGG